MVELYILLILMIIGAIVAVEVKDLLSSVIAVGAAGLALSIIFLILKAPDVAITQLVVEILALIILIRATLKKDLPFSTTGRWLINTIITACFILVLVAIGMKCFQDLPEFGYPTMRV
ncbi:hydrogenase subunit MbhD domain-containing protein, partial [Candidatus Omnitrophota bacterium]